MRRIVGWIGGALGGITAYRLLRRRPQVAPERSAEPVPTEPDSRAEELRSRIAESRAAQPEAEPVVEEPPAETVAEGDAVEPESPEERRQRVHDEGRATLDEMRSD
jgi:hypothetical protein